MDAWIETYTGIKFNPFCPKPEDINTQDIAHGLSNICRFNGQCKFFFSVAQHSINAMASAKRRGYSKRIQLLCLFHDAAEAYISDVPSPVKQHIPQFRQIEDTVMSVIYEFLNIEPPNATEQQIIKEIDGGMLVTEAQKLMHCNGWGDWTKGFQPDEEILIIHFPSIELIEGQFIAEAERLIGKPK